MRKVVVVVVVVVVAVAVVNRIRCKTRAQNYRKLIYFLEKILTVYKNILLCSEISLVQCS
jgi:hypothetical protein